MQQAVELGAPCFWADGTTTSLANDGATLEVSRVCFARRPRAYDSFDRAHVGPMRPSDFSLILYRTDPPVDVQYLHPLQLIASDVRLRARQQPSHVCEVVNPVKVLCTCSEKLLAVHLPDMSPPSLAASQWERLRRFGLAEGLTIAKPLHECQSKGVELLDWTSRPGEERCGALLRELTADFRRPVLLQRYLPGVCEGETRVWFLDGVPLAWARKKPCEGSYRIDMDKGGTLAPHELTARERTQAVRLGVVLRQEAIRLAAVDLIDGWATDFNFTSPGLLPAMEELLGRNLALPIVQALVLRAQPSTTQPALPETAP
jgi:glutathione synthase